MPKKYGNITKFFATVLQYARVCAIVRAYYIFEENLYMQNELKSKKWDEIEEKYGEGVRHALSALFDYYEGIKIAEWVCSLYDPETGGFYYSRSARDAEGYAPDLESTSQALSVLAEIGAVPTNKIADIIPADIRDSVIDFVRKRQSPIDGYFYHPQWPIGKEKLATDRYGRDIGNATSVLRRVPDASGEFALPYYCTVNGKKCKKHADGECTCTFPIPLSERMDTVIVHDDAVTDATDAQPTAKTGSHPVYTSREDFIAWLEEYNATIHKDSGRAHNLAAISEEIAMHGYADDLIEHLNRKQKELFEEQQALGEEIRGIWQRDINYKAVWGTYKYTFIYNRYGKALDLKYVPYMVKTCLEVIKLPPLKNYAYNDLMNQWSAIGTIIQNVRTHYGQEEADKIHAMVRTDAASLIENSLAKMLPFKMEDGAFCNNVNGFTSPGIYGTPIAVGGCAEGNMNSTHILLNMYYSICGVLGCPSVPLCDESAAEQVAKMLADKKSAYLADK